MEVTLTKMELNINKSNWTKVKFGEVVFEPKESTKTPLEDGITHVVGLEHITSGDIHLRRSASIEEQTTFTKKFAKEDVLFGRRRAYLKKAARAEFDGICSGDITVFRAKENLLPELLPFIVNNDTFFDYAVKHSAGGLSPRVKFKDLANYEFLLPPKDHQAKLAKLLWAMDEVIEKEIYTLNSTETLFRTDLKQIFLNKKLNYKRLHNIIDLSTGKRMKGGGLKDGEILSIGGENINDSGQLVFEKNKYISKDFFDLMKHGVIKKGDILMMKDGAKTGKVALVNIDITAATNEHLFIVRSKAENLNQKFLFYFFLSDYGQQQIRNFFHGIIGGVTRDDVYDLKIPIYNLNSQNLQVEKFDKYNSSINKLKSKITSSQSLLKSIINQVF